ncbi:MAG: cation diffusion facilitator family transporter [Candidatus Limnocylindria bacterium]
MAWALGIAAVYMVAEIVGGLVANSLALLADAGHMATDVGALGLALWAMRLAEKPAEGRRTYGYHRAEILAALANGAVLVAVTLYIFYEAWRRLQDPPEVLGGMMLAVAVGGLVVNGVGLWLLQGGREESLNVRGAWLHVLGDALGSVAVIAGAVLIWVFGWRWADRRRARSSARSSSGARGSSSRSRSTCSWRPLRATSTSTPSANRWRRCTALTGSTIFTCGSSRRGSRS